MSLSEKLMDPISNMLSQIKNAQAVLKPEVFIPFSNIKYKIAKILEKEKFIEKAERKGRGVDRKIKIILKYKNRNQAKEGFALGQPIISGIKRISKPGQRIYLSLKSIKPVRGGLGIAIISTPQGLMTDKEARKKHLAGEIICEVW